MLSTSRVSVHAGCHNYFPELYGRIQQYLKVSDWYVWANMDRGQITMAVFQSLDAYWPGIQVGGAATPGMEQVVGGAAPPGREGVGGGATPPGREGVVGGAAPPGREGLVGGAAPPGREGVVGGAAPGREGVVVGAAPPGREGVVGGATPLCWLDSRCAPQQKLWLH